MTCLGYLKEEKDVRIEPHLDEEDVITALFFVKATPPAFSFG